MKKLLLILGLAAGMLTACDPVTDEGKFVSEPMTAESLMNGATFSQYNKVTADDGTESYVPAADGNYIMFNFPNVSAVTAYYVKNGEKKTLSYGRSGAMIYYLPSRGSDPQQTLYFSYLNQDGKEVVAEKQFTLQVAQALDPAVKVLVSNKGTKKWKWMPTSKENGAVWGNGGYPLGIQDGSINIEGAWWGCGVIGGDANGDFSGQDSHTGGKYDDIKGECYALSYMEFSEDGTITTYSNEGVKINEGTFSITNYNNNEITDASTNSRGILETSAGAILWPFSINTNGKQPTQFKIAYLDASRMILFAEGGESWECTWWSFMSDDDPGGILSSHDWHWRPTDVNGGGAVWGNGSCPMGPQDGTTSINDAWWGCGVNDGDCKNKFSDQMNHAGPAYVAGEEYSTSKMVFNEDESTITIYDKDGNKIREGSFSLDMTPNPEQSSIGTLNTSEGTILWPFAINTNGFQPTTFQIGYLSSDALILIYPRPDIANPESTWWSFGK